MSELIGWLGPAWLMVKAAHVIIVIFWIAGLFMLPRYLAYQAETEPGAAEDLHWRQRTRRIRRIILDPAMLLAWLLGLALAFNHGFAGAYWLHAKLLLVLLLSIYQLWIVSVAGRMQRGIRPLSSRALRIANEVPGIATIAIVILAVVRPF